MLAGIADTDFYKFTMQFAILQNFPNAWAKYKFINRRLEGRFTPGYVARLRDSVSDMSGLLLEKSTRQHLAKTCPFLPPHYLEYLANYRFNTEQVKIALTPTNELDIWIEGPWHETVLWEVPLMALISELYYQVIDTDWDDDHKEQTGLAKAKSETLERHGCFYSEFGTRRRRSFQSQKIFIDECRHYPTFVGTSNVFFSERLGLAPKGTIAHEYYQGVSALMGLRHANRWAMDTWNQTYQGNLGIALPDTFGRKAFFADFSLNHAKMWDGLRQDSGNPFEFTADAIEAYRKFGIDPRTKVTLYSNSLSCAYEFNGKTYNPPTPEEDVVVIQRYAARKTVPRFGIGTFFSNDFRKHSNSSKVSPALNMVIKLWGIDDVPVVKLSDDPRKAMGDPNAIADAMWTFNQTPIRVEQ